MTDPGRDPERERIRGYLQAQAAARTIEEIIAGVREGAAELAAAALAIPPERWQVPHPGEEWSPAECLQHAVGADLAVATQVLHVALTGELPPYREEPTDAGDRHAALRRHEEGMDSLFAHVREAEPSAFLSVTWTHPFFGDLNWREWLLFLRIHAKDHARQLEKMAD